MGPFRAILMEKRRVKSMHSSKTNGQKRQSDGEVILSPRLQELLDQDTDLADLWHSSEQLDQHNRSEIRGSNQKSKKVTPNDLPREDSVLNC